MSICAKPEQFASLEIGIRDFGSGPCLATQTHGATIVLMVVQGSNGRAEIRACDSSGRLSAEGARPVLERIVRLWNANLEPSKIP